METKIKIPRGYTFIWNAVSFINHTLIILGFRKKRGFWGIVYDSVSKQPLDPVIVKLAYVQTGRVIETCVTDLEGRYGFLAHPGKFKILAQKTNYSFPSAIVAGGKDGMFDDVYHGEFFQLDENAEVIAPNIPMDPLRQDWNQEAKAKVFKTSYYRDYFLRRLIITLTWFFFALLAVYAFFMPSLPVYAGLGIYLLLLLLSLSVPEVRLWGIVLDTATGQPMSGVFLELQPIQLEGIVMGKAVSVEDGRYFLRANPGKYRLIVKHSPDGKQFTALGQGIVTVGLDRVLNRKILI